MNTASRAFLAIGWAAAMIGIAGAGTSTAQDTVVLSEELRTAFYEHAPSGMAAAMESAVHSYCNAKTRGPTAALEAAASQPGWLCVTSQHQYLRNVYLSGARGNHGLVCEDAGLIKLRYLGVDLASEQVAAHNCVPVEFDGSAYRVMLPSSANHSDA